MLSLGRTTGIGWALNYSSRPVLFNQLIFFFQSASAFEHTYDKLTIK